MGSSSKEEAMKEAETSSGDASPGKGRGSGSGGGVIFSEGERVLAYHGPRVYEAKIQKADLRKKELKYFVHYLGWNKNWDEWVSAERLLKHTEENVKKQQALDKKRGISKSGRSNPSKTRSSIEPKMDKEDAKTNVGRGKKRKAESGNEKDNHNVDKLIKIGVPSSLKKQLVDDWEFVTRKDNLVKLPRSPTVDDILTEYLEYRTKKDVTITDSISEILKGIRCYFDKALSAMLLYKKERKQYEDAIVDDISPSTVYGAEHLLRLFVKLPELLAYVNLEDEASSHLQQTLMDLLKFLQKNQSTFFLSAYKSIKVSEDKDIGKDD